MSGKALIPFRIVFERVKNTQFQGIAVINNDLYQYIAILSLLCL